MFAQGGEGVVMRDPQAVGCPSVIDGILKFKPYEDAEARIIGFTSAARRTRAAGIHGTIGALIVDYNGKRLDCPA